MIRHNAQAMNVMTVNQNIKKEIQVRIAIIVKEYHHRPIILLIQMDIV